MSNTSNTPPYINFTEYYPNYPPNNNHIPLGWQCPICKTVYSPNVLSCHKHEDINYNLTSSNTDAVKLNDQEKRIL